MHLELVVVHAKFRPPELGHQMGVEIAPWFSHGRRSAGHRHRLERSETFVVQVIGQQKLAAPDGAVVTPSQAIENDAQHGRRIQLDLVLGQASRHMGVMVLHLDQRKLGLGRIRTRELR
jgi:hypothetical protein